MDNQQQQHQHQQENPMLNKKNIPCSRKQQKETQIVLKKQPKETKETTDIKTRFTIMTNTPSTSPHNNALIDSLLVEMQNKQSEEFKDYTHSNQTFRFSY